MTTTRRAQQRYDHRLRDLVHSSVDVTIATDLGVPRSTARGWLRKKPSVAVTLDVTNVKTAELQSEVLEELKQLRQTFPSSAEDYERLNSVSENIADFADDVVNPAERLVAPRGVFIIMSFKKEYLDVLDSCKEVCREFQFEAERTDEPTSLERITPRIENGIRRSAFATFAPRNVNQRAHCRRAHATPAWANARVT